MVLCVMVLCSQRLCAQEMLLGVEEMFRIADRNSVSIQTYSTGIESADEELKAAKSQRLPDINASLSASFLGDGRLWNRDFSGGTGIDIPSFGNNFALEASQVIYAGGAVDSRIELAQIEKQMAELDWQKNRQDMHFLLLGWYLDLYKTLNQIKVLDRNLELADHVIENMQVRMEEGTVLKNDLTRYELQKETLELQRTVLQDGCRILNHQIVTVLHLPDSVKVVPDSSMLSCGILALEEQDWQQKAAQNSIDLRRSELGVRVNEQNLRLERSARLPQIAVMAAEHVLEETFLGEVMHYPEVVSVRLDWFMLAGVVAGCLFSWWWMHMRRFNYLRLIIAGISGIIFYLLWYYFMISSDIRISFLYVPTAVRGFAYAVLSATFMVCLEEIMSFRHFFQALSVFNMLHMVVGGVSEEDIFQAVAGSGPGRLGDDRNLLFLHSTINGL